MKTLKTSAFRKMSMYGFDAVAGSHNFYALLEFDITELRPLLRKRRVEGKGGSLLAFILKAIGLCLEKYPNFNSIIDYARTSTFDQVDINIPVEIIKDGVLVPKQYIIRNITKKSLGEISDEIEASKKTSHDARDYAFSPIILKLFAFLPKGLVVLLIKALMRNHRKVQELSGTVFVTSVSMFSNAPGYIIPYIGGPKACSFALGSSVKKPLVLGDTIVIRELMNVTAIFNHDIIDGAPAARFINDLRRLIEKDFMELLQ